MNEIDIKVKNFRIAQISNICSGLRPASEGLAIEKRCNEGYIVIAFMRSAPYGEVEFDCVRDRILDIDDDEFPIFKEVCKIAKGIVSLLNDDMTED